MVANAADVKITNVRLHTPTMKGIAMIKYFILMLSFGFIVSSQVCMANDVLNDNRITVFGKAEVNAPADHAKISFSISGFGSSLRGAVDKAKEKIASVSKKIVEIGLKKKDLNTSYFYSGENHGGKPFMSDKEDYRADITMYISVEDLRLLESVLFLLSENNVDNISKVHFSIKDDSSYKQKARKLAVQKAKVKAEEYAKELNIQVGRATLVHEVPQAKREHDQYYQYRMREMASNVSYNSFLRGESDPQDVGGHFTDTIQVLSAVKVVFKIKE